MFKEIDPEIKLETLKKDGQALKIKDIICKITGPAQSLLAGERTALNFLQHMSGIATYTAKFVSIASRYKARVADTRKTKPGLRKLEKYAVLCGGGFNHRFGLFDGVLIKDNHIVAAGSIGNAIEQIRQKIPHNQKIEVEVKNERETLEAIKHNADIIMLDNMDTKEIKKSVELIRSKTSGSCLIEVSGGVNLESLEDICKTGVDIVSAGCITHSAPAVDFSMEFA